MAVDARIERVGCTSKPVADAHVTCHVLLRLSRDSRAEVDTLAESAARAGGKADACAPIDMDFLYNRAIEDPDGHVFELVWMNPEAMPGHDTKSASAAVA